MSTSEPSGLEFRQLPDSPDARLFIELSSYAADLTEARAALELALAGVGDDGLLGDARLFLIGYAAVAYCRTYFPSNVRAPMTNHVSIPDDHAELHARITEYRNRRVAHSQSQLASTFAFVGLDADGSIRQSILGVTAAHEIPASFLKRWLTLIDLIFDQVDELQREVERRILQDAAAKDIDEVRAWRIGPTLSEQPDSAFTAKPSRGTYPTELTIFWTPVD